MKGKIKKYFEMWKPKKSLGKTYMSPLSYAVMSIVTAGMVWIFSLKRWMAQGIYIPGIDLAISSYVVDVIILIGSQIIVGIGILTSWVMPTVTNAFVNAGISIFLIFALYTAEKDFKLTCFIVGTSFILPALWGIWRYLFSRREWYHRIYFYLCARIWIAIFLMIGILPWMVWNLFSELYASDIRRPLFSTEIEISRAGDDKDFYYLYDLDKMWSRYSLEERFGAMEELVGYECGRLGISAVKMETKKEELGIIVSSYHSGQDLIGIDIVELRTRSLKRVLPDMLKACRSKYRHQLKGCMERLEKAGKNIKTMPDFSWGYKLLELERMAENKEIAWEQYYDICFDDENEWGKNEIEHLKEIFGWTI